MHETGGVGVPTPPGAAVARRVLETTAILGLGMVRSPADAVVGRSPLRGLRDAFIRLGPVWVKLGQVVASTPAFFPAPVQRELRDLLDRVPPFSPARAEHRARRALGDRLETFDPTPLASASLAQVHRARVDGRSVAVKVLRPGVAERIELDLTVLRFLAPMLERLPGSGLTRLGDVVDDFARTLRGELDLDREAAETAAARAFLARVGSEDVFVPSVVAATREVLVTELVEGVPIDAVLRPGAGGPDPARLLQSMLLRLQEMVLVRGRFHGDLHAGNVLVAGEGRLAWIDWGIVGSLGPDGAVAAGRVLAGALQLDFTRLAEGIEGLGVSLTDRPALAAELERALAPLLADRVRAVDLSRLSRRTLGVLLRHRVEVPASLVLLAKQVAYFDRFARALVPHRRLLEDATEILAYFVAVHPQLVEQIAPDDLADLVGESSRGGAVSARPMR
ncbi:MAG: AarF/UbiB family protein [Acidimicrobiia bacterium]|nr:AarF/UbiB family protein [Acidimicrobiia bacterium]